MIGMMKERRRKGVFCMKIGVARSNEVKARAFADDASPTPRGENTHQDFQDFSRE